MVLLKLKSRTRSVKVPSTLEVPTSATIDDLRKLLHSHTRLNVNRQRLTLENKTALTNPSQTLEAAGVKEGDIVYVKDLGPQISWTTVFVVEYLGPILIHPIFYYSGLQKLIYGREFEHSNVQYAVLIMVILHFLKREYETLFVHRFSLDTMPAFNIFKNSAHYWFLSGFNLAYWVYGPWAAKNNMSQNALYACVAAWVFAQISNYKCHAIVRDLRPAGSRERKIPRGYGFNLVSFPNYFFETMGWTIVAWMTRSFAAYLFLIVSSGQMLVWAIKKHQRYRKEFKDYPRGRKAMFPFII
ncbi:Very-long-chain enoyl-CoA reductase [Saitoella coloradoensis]